MAIKSPQKIAVIGPVLTSSGSSTHTKNIVTGLSELPEWEAILITYMEPNAVFNYVRAPGVITNKDPEPLEKRLLELPNKEKQKEERLLLPVKTYVFEEVISPDNLARFYGFLENIIIKEKISVLHPQTKPFVLFSAVMASAKVWEREITPPKIIATWHSNFGWIKDAKYHLALAIKSGKFADGFIPVSMNVKEDIINYLSPEKEKILEIIPPGGIDLEKIQKPREKLTQKLRRELGISERYIVFLGRMLYNKGVDVLLKAYKQVVERQAFVDLVIIGKGPFKEDFVSMGEKMGLKIFDREKNQTYNEQGLGKVVFTGFVTDEEVYALLQGGTIFCLPSRWESFSISTLEAMGAGLPVVCTNVGGIPFWVGDSAVLVPPDSPEKTSKAMLDLLTNEKKRKEYIQKSLEKAKQYHWRALAKKTSEQIKRILSDKQTTQSKPWGALLDGEDGIMFDENTGKIKITKPELIENKKLELPREMLISSEALFFPSETIEKGNYFVFKKE